MCKSNDDKPNNATEENQAGVTRRNLLKQGTAAALTGVAAAASSRLAAQQSSATSSAGQTSSVPPVGETFKAFVRQPAGAEIQDVRLLPIQENMVVVRSEAAQWRQPGCGSGRS
jgi:hypothetical protein